METTALYDTFTNPRVVTSMLLLGIGLGIALCILLKYLWGQWYMPIAFAALCAGTLAGYLYWLDRQDFRDD